MIKTTLNICFLLLTTQLSAQLTLVKDIRPGSASAIFNNVILADLSVGNTLFFAADDGVHGVEMWKSDGTEAGTSLVKDINPSTTQDGVDAVLFGFDGKLYFIGNEPATGSELWQTDGSEAGTVLFRDVCMAEFFHDANQVPSDFAVNDGKLYFNGDALLPAPQFYVGPQLWVSDGTPAGTILIKVFNPNGLSDPKGLAFMNGQLYFSVIDTALNRELWTSDGTEAGTYIVKDILPGVNGSDPSDLMVGNGHFFFYAKTVNEGVELWISDGTEAGTKIVKDINPGSADGLDGSYDLSERAHFTPDGRLLFTADDGVHGKELWITDGTEAGTQLVLDIDPGIFGSGIRFLKTLNNQVLFRAGTSPTGSELWSTDGTAANTKMIKDINPGPANGFTTTNLVFSAIHQGKMYFAAGSNITGRELWVTDGTESGTALLYDINPGTAASNPAGFYIINDQLYLFATTPEYGRELWKYDLSTIGTNAPSPTLNFDLFPTASAGGLFTIQTAPATERLQVTIFDALGRQRTTQVLNTGTQQLNLSALPTGAYFVQITGMETRQSGVERVFIMR